MKQFLFYIGLLCISNFLIFPVSYGQKRNIKELEERITTSPIFSQIFTGFALYHPKQDSFLYTHEAEKYYTPASNTKLFTLYTSLIVLGDSIPTLVYQETDTSIIFWGASDPSFLNPLLPKDTSVLSFLKNKNKKLYFSGHNFRDVRFGPGWSWDDYSYTYQTEKSPFPIYGNNITFDYKNNQIGFIAIPSFFQEKVQLNPNLPNQRPEFSRLMNENIFECNTAALTGNMKYKITVPFRYSDELFVALLADTLKRQVYLQTQPIPASNIRYLYSQIPADSIYQLMMQESDNFVAEQLLNACANKLFGVQDQNLIIDYAIKNLLNDLPHVPRWVDGSGLSRYNLFTPKSIAILLKKIYATIPQEKLFNIFAAGGISGTIENWYAPEEKARPYVYAKTGTLSNKHCLSGYIITKKNEVLIFSFMHNNYLGSNNPIRKEMQNVLEFIRDNF